MVKWSWDASEWKASLKVLLGLLTIWPLIYMGLFFIGIFGLMILMPFERGGVRQAENIDLIELQQKIVNGELEELTVTPTEMLARDRLRNRTYTSRVTSDSTRAELLRQAREVDENGKPRVARIVEDTAQTEVSPFVPICLAAVFGAHLITMVLIMGLMPLYIILAIKSERVDQTMKIIWAVLICMLGLLAMPVYWYLYIWRKAPPTATVANLG